MIDQLRNAVISILMEYKSVKTALSLIGALLVAAGFQDYSIWFVPPGVLAATGILIEVSLVYVVSIGIEKARQDIEKHRREINEMVREIKDVSREVRESKDEVGSVRRDVNKTKDEISQSQREIEDASETAQKAKKQIEDLKQDIRREARKFR